MSDYSDFEDSVNGQAPRSVGSSNYTDDSDAYDDEIAAINQSINHPSASTRGAYSDQRSTHDDNENDDYDDDFEEAKKPANPLTPSYSDDKNESYSDTEEPGTTKQVPQSPKETQSSHVPSQVSSMYEEGEEEEENYCSSSGKQSVRRSSNTRSRSSRAVTHRPSTARPRPCSTSLSRRPTTSRRYRPEPHPPRTTPRRRVKTARAKRGSLAVAVRESMAQRRRDARVEFANRTRMYIRRRVQQQQIAREEKLERKRRMKLKREQTIQQKKQQQLMKERQNRLRCHQISQWLRRVSSQPSETTHQNLENDTRYDPPYSQNTNIAGNRHNRSNKSTRRSHQHQRYFSREEKLKQEFIQGQEDLRSWHKQFKSTLKHDLANSSLSNCYRDILSSRKGVLTGNLRQAMQAYDKEYQEDVSGYPSSVSAPNSQMVLHFGDNCDIDRDADARGVLAVDAKRALRRYYHLMDELKESVHNSQAPSVVHQVLFTPPDEQPQYETRLSGHSSLSPRSIGRARPAHRQNPQNLSQTNDSEKAKELEIRRQAWNNHVDPHHKICIPNYDAIGDPACLRVATKNFVRHVKRTRDVSPFLSHLLDKRVKQRDRELRILNARAERAASRINGMPVYRSRRRRRRKPSQKSLHVLNPSAQQRPQLRSPNRDGNNSHSQTGNFGSQGSDESYDNYDNYDTPAQKEDDLTEDVIIIDWYDAMLNWPQDNEEHDFFSYLDRLGIENVPDYPDRDLILNSRPLNDNEVLPLSQSVLQSLASQVGFPTNQTPSLLHIEHPSCPPPPNSTAQQHNRYLESQHNANSVLLSRVNSLWKARCSVVAAVDQIKEREECVIAINKSSGLDETIGHIDRLSYLDSKCMQRFDQWAELCPWLHTHSSLCPKRNAETEYYKTSDENDQGGEIVFAPFIFKGDDYSQKIKHEREMVRQFEMQQAENARKHRSDDQSPVRTGGIPSSPPKDTKYNRFTPSGRATQEDYFQHGEDPSKLASMAVAKDRGHPGGDGNSMEMEDVSYLDPSDPQQATFLQDPHNLARAAAGVIIDMNRKEAQLVREETGLHDY